MEGPSEFAEGMAIGVRSVFSGVVGGAAGTVSRITGALGKGLASLTFDEKFQKKRRETIKRRNDGDSVLNLANAYGPKVRPHMYGELKTYVNFWIRNR